MSGRATENHPFREHGFKSLPLGLTSFLFHFLSYHIWLPQWFTGLLSPYSAWVRFPQWQFGTIPKIREPTLMDGINRQCQLHIPLQTHNGLKNTHNKQKTLYLSFVLRYTVPCLKEDGAHAVWGSNPIL